MPFAFIPTVNLIKVPVAGVSPEIDDMVPGILKEMQNSRILEDMDLAIRAINELLPDPVPATSVVDTKGYPSYRLFGDLGYYRLDTRYKAKKTNNPLADLQYKITWFGQELYICTNIRENNCYLTVMSTNVKNQELLIRLMNYKYAFKRYGIKAISN
jgi:hypothetical protein